VRVGDSVYARLFSFWALRLGSAAVGFSRRWLLLGLRRLGVGTGTGFAFDLATPFLCFSLLRLLLAAFAG
jgi:hypothetical protein